MHSPRKSHLELVIRVLRYLKLNHGKMITIRKTNNRNLIAHVAAEWERCLSSRRSVTGFWVFLRESLEFWKSKIHDTLSWSSVKVGYRDFASITCEIL